MVGLGAGFLMSRLSSGSVTDGDEGRIEFVITHMHPPGYLYI